MPFDLELLFSILSYLFVHFCVLSGFLCFKGSFQAHKSGDMSCSRWGRTPTHVHSHPHNTSSLSAPDPHAIPNLSYPDPHVIPNFSAPDPHVIPYLSGPRPACYIPYYLAPDPHVTTSPHAIQPIFKFLN